MKILRFNEKLTNEPKIGDYVVCDEWNTSPDIIDYNIFNFTLNNVGQYFIDRGKSENFRYLIKYESVPDELTEYFNDDDEENCRRMGRKEIVYWSKNKKDADAFITSKKYNL